MMDYISFEDAFKVTRIVQEKYPEYLYCHVLGHELSARETRKDPSKWMDVITRCPSTMCNNGCLHGSMMQRFNSESLTDEQIKKITPDIKNICEPRGSWKPKLIEQSMCYHAIGHLAMYITAADINKSAELCQIIGKKDDGRDHVQTCTQGVFMQIFQPLEPEDFALVKNLTQTKKTVGKFCDTFKDKLMMFDACISESWPLFRALLMNPRYMEKFCSYSDRPYVYKKCQSNMMSMVTVSLTVNQSNLPGLGDFCQALSNSEKKSDCFASAAGRLIQIDPLYLDKALSVCQMASKSNLGDNCYKTVVQYGMLSFFVGSKEYKDYCAKLPAHWSDICLKTK